MPQDSRRHERVEDLLLSIAEVRLMPLTSTPASITARTNNGGETRAYVRTSHLHFFGD